MENSYKTNWDLSLLYSGDDDQKLEEDMKSVEKYSYEFINKWKDRVDYLSNELILKEALDDYEYWYANYGSYSRQSYFFWLRTCLDQNNPDFKASFGKINDLSCKIDNDRRFFPLNLAKIDKDFQKKILVNPLFSDYKNFLSCIFDESTHLLSEKEENLVNLKDKTAYGNWANLIDELLSIEERKIYINSKLVSKNFSQILGEIVNKNKKTRDSATKALNGVFEKIMPIAEREFNSILEYCKTEDTIRGYSRPDSARHLSDNIDTSVVDSLVKSVSSAFDISRDFYELKAKLFKTKKLKYNERCLEYGKIEGDYDFDNSINLIKSTFSNIDKDFYDIVLDLINGHVDVFPGKGKTDGAFCVTGSKNDPVYVLLNHNNKLNDVLTVAHEFGHAINDYFMARAQNALNVGNSLAVAEVASTFFEDFILEKILESGDDELKLSIIMMKLNGDVSTIFRQIAFYKFETEVHYEYRKKGYLSHQEIGIIFQKHMKDYMGEYIEHSKGTENWWVYVGHFRNPFYVYSYASGLLISKAMQNKFKNNSEFITKVKEFLAAGISKSPKDIFLDMDIDISDKKFWDDGLMKIRKLLDEAEILGRRLGKVR